MSVDFPSSSPANSASVRKPVDLQTLQETFAAVLRSYGTAKTGNQTDSMLEVLQTSQADNAEVRKQERQEYQQRIDPNDTAQIDRKVQNKSDIRQGELNVDYQNQRDRQEILQTDHQEKVEQHARQTPVDFVNTSSASMSENLPNHSANQNVLPTSGNVVPMQNGHGSNVSQNVVPVSQSSASAMQHAVINESAVTALPLNTTGGHVPPALAQAPQVLPVNAFTIFTASKKFGQNQEQQDEKENEDEKEESVEALSAETLPIKKSQPFALFEAIQAGTRQIQHRQSRESTHSPSIQQSAIQQAAKQLHEKPKEIESNGLSNVQALDEFLNTTPNVIMPQKKEANQPEQSPYFHRIAAACEAAAQFAPIRIKVHLGHLGTMTLRFFYQSEKLMLQFETPSEESALFLREQLEGLQTLLSKRKVRLDSVEVMLTDKATASGGLAEHQ